MTFCFHLLLPTQSEKAASSSEEEVTDDGESDDDSEGKEKSNGGEENESNQEVEPVERIEWNTKEEAKQAFKELLRDKVSCYWDFLKF